MYIFERVDEMALAYSIRTYSLLDYSIEIFHYYSILERFSFELD